MNLPKITAMYRVKNEERWIEKSIQSVLDICSTIVVLDDGSSDSTLEICKSFDNVIVQSQLNLPLDESTPRTFRAPPNTKNRGPQAPNSARSRPRILRTPHPKSCTPNPGPTTTQR